MNLNHPTSHPSDSLSTPARLLEICVESVEAALAAGRGGANRIELCAKLSVGGVTPSIEMMRTAREQIPLPIFAMIRPRAGNFVYTSSEFSEMKNSIAVAKASRMDGMVLGILNENRMVDVERTREVVRLAHPLQVTYHRAFDETADLYQALEDVIESGARCILTSGGKPSASEGGAIIKKLIIQAGNRIPVMPGSGIHAGNVALLSAETGACQFHAGLSSVVPPNGSDFHLFEIEVRKLADQIKNLP